MVTAIAAVAVSSFVDLLVIAATVGASFTAVTERVKVCDAVRKPSEITKVMSALPLALATGVMVPVQLGHVPLHAKAPVVATTLALLDE